jgi:hypothetical protein
MRAGMSQTISLVLIIIQKSAKLAKLPKKASTDELTAVYPLRLTKPLNLKNRAPLYFYD